jgi:exopolyphosphatase / guanosine-5'-triphosphate,3'-diphosphate pyrophosphatase
MIIASIDIGTNTILLLLAEISESGISRVLYNEQAIVRLGVAVDAGRMLRKDAMDRAAECLRRYQETARSYGADKIIAVGTSALRDAGNSDAFCAYIADTVGIHIEILPGVDEARWTFRGGISEFADRAREFSVIDIGGGSTEVIVGTTGTIESKHSFDVGCVRLTERFLHSNPPTEPELEQARAFVRNMFHPVSSYRIPDTFAVGVSGTMTTMAAIEQELAEYEPEKVSGWTLDRSAIGEIFTRLKPLPREAIRRLPQVADGRADIIVAGILIAETYMEMANIPRIVVSDRGLRYGIVYREVDAIRAGNEPDSRR